MLKKFKRIAIIGNAGSGKTTLALKLEKKLNLPLYHLDEYYWKPNWQRSELADFAVVHSELCEKEKWIIEGSYYNVMYERLLAADAIIFLDVNRYKCIWRVIKRTIINYGKVLKGNPRGCKQRLFSFEYFDFLKWVWAFDKRYKKTLLSMLNFLKKSESKKVFVLKTAGDIQSFAESL